MNPKNLPVYNSDVNVNLVDNDSLAEKPQSHKDKCNYRLTASFSPL